MDKNVLFLVEGKDDEVNMFKTLFKIMNPKAEFNYYVYNTNLHVLAKQLKKEGYLEDEYLNIKSYLKSLGNWQGNQYEYAVLEKNFASIFLIFDLDPHDSQIDYQLIDEMLKIFNDDTENGKLYINYPMIESLKHFEELPDQEFYDLKVELKDIPSYKELVGSITRFSNIKSYDYTLWISIATHHFKKALYIMNRTCDISAFDSDNGIDHMQIFQKQNKLIHEKDCLYVLNTSILWLVEYQPEKFLQQITKHATSFYI